MNQFFGKYRGKVKNNADPLFMGRIQVSVPAIYGDRDMSWAMPCVPYAGSGVGFFAIPAEGANVWVEFEGGDTDHPIWTGCFWDEGGAPGKTATSKVLKTSEFTLTIEDVQGATSVSLETSSGMKISIGVSEIEITNGQGGAIKLSGPQVSINDGALEVT
jgi:uncharacterized protein involved in type VI secretion and phage assembly